MNLNQLHYFSKLAKAEHYTKAAEELGISQPSLSHAIGSLEQELGTKLFRYDRALYEELEGRVLSSAQPAFEVSLRSAG